MTQIEFKPSVPPESEPALCGQIFQQAVHLYLLTSLPRRQELLGSQEVWISGCIDSAFALLTQLSPLARINTSLGWALAVIGACTTSSNHQEQLRNRLSVMYCVIGLGNIKATATLLQHFWSLPQSERSPWVICQVMQENQLWISLA